MSDAPAIRPDMLMRVATAYLARHAASSARVRAVLARRIARLRKAAGTGPGEDDPSGLIDPVIERLRRAGLLDDAAFARGHAASLAAKGRPAWRIKADLAHGFGIDAEDAGLVDVLGELDPMAQALRWARRRRLGPFRLRDRQARRDRDIASLARAGFPGDIARAVIDGDGATADGGDATEDGADAIGDGEA